mmetsp:Transcript_9261/g.22597  ORF Transcript_9261/g.22597 Transcript_9261/m.22597 type:complete len:405 (+) Transcript_9261:241-1455(+)
MGTKKRRVLWRRPSSAREDNGINNGAHYDVDDHNNSVLSVEEETLEFRRIRNLRRPDEILNSKDDDDDDGDDSPSSLIITTPPVQPLIELVDRSLALGQEVALTVLLLAVHREIVVHESQEQSDERPELPATTDHDPTADHPASKKQSSLDLAMLIIDATLLAVVYYSRYRSSGSDNPHDNRGGGNHHGRKPRAIVRLSDGITLASLLRFLSGVLRTLTASCSTDTVIALAMSGMVVHLLACDYRYANGEPTSVVADNAMEDGNSNDDHLPESRHPRPPFRGGTVSLNAAFFSTVLLVSRIRSNATSCAFVSSVVALFAFYPAWRHNIAGIYPNTVRGSPCFIITVALSLAAWLILSPFEKVLFAGMQFMVFVFSPCLQWRLQRHKQIITGPWDIAHIRHVPTT